jgi:hypothetical protein
MDTLLWLLTMAMLATIAWHAGRQHERGCQHTAALDKERDEVLAATRAAEATSAAEQQERCNDPKRRSLDEKVDELELDFRLAFDLRPDRKYQTRDAYIAMLEESLRDGRPHPSITVRLPASAVIDLRARVQNDSQQEDGDARSANADAESGVAQPTFTLQQQAAIQRAFYQKFKKVPLLGATMSPNEFAKLLQESIQKGKIDPAVHVKTPGVKED